MSGENDFNRISKREAREKIKNIKIKLKLPLLLLFLLFIFFVFFFNLFVWDPHVSFFHIFPFQPRNSLFRPGFNFIYPI